MARVWHWAKAKIVPLLAVGYAVYELYERGGVPAGAAVPAVVAFLYAFDALIEWTGWSPKDSLAVARPADWLDDAQASHQRGTDISTLAVRYDVDPEWLTAELSRLAPTPRV